MNTQLLKDLIGLYESGQIISYELATLVRQWVESYDMVSLKQDYDRAVTEGKLPAFK